MEEGYKVKELIGYIDLDPMNGRDPLFTFVSSLSPSQFHTTQVSVKRNLEETQSFYRFSGVEGALYPAPGEGRIAIHRMILDDGSYFLTSNETIRMEANEYFVSYFTAILGHDRLARDLLDRTTKGEDLFFVLNEMTNGKVNDQRSLDNLIRSANKTDIIYYPFLFDKTIGYADEVFSLGKPALYRLEKTQATIHYPYEGEIFSLTENVQKPQPITGLAVYEANTERKCPKQYISFTISTNGSIYENFAGARLLHTQVAKENLHPDIPGMKGYVERIRVYLKGLFEDEQ